MRLGSKPPLWLWPNLLSLDAPVIALLWQYLFLKCFHAPLNLVPAILLACSVWLIYVADRVLDANRENGSSPRHLFCWRYRRILLPVWSLVFAFAAWLAFTLPAALLAYGVAILIAVGAYLLAIHRRNDLQRSPGTGWSKEAAVGLLFGLGTTVAVWEQVKTPADFVTICLFSGLCWLNCVAIESWESTDGRRFTRLVSPAAAGLAILGFVLFWAHRPVLGGAEVASAIGILGLDRGRRRFSPNALRVLADVALLTPIAFLPIAGRI